MLFAFADPALTGELPPEASRRHVGRVWVDSGQMSILDAATRSAEDTQDAMLFPLFHETLVLDRGCMSRSGFGDGNYPVFATSRGDKATWLGVDFASEDDGLPTPTRQFMEQVEQKIRGVK